MAKYTYTSQAEQLNNATQKANASQAKRNEVAGENPSKAATLGDIQALQDLVELQQLQIQELLGG